jgi:hypothetical protein
MNCLVARTQRFGFVLGVTALVVCEAGCGSNEATTTPSSGSTGQAANASHASASQGSAKNPASTAGAGKTTSTATKTGVNSGMGAAGVGASQLMGNAGAASAASADEWPADCEQHYKFLANTNGAGKFSVPAGTEQHPQFFFTPSWPANSQGLKFKSISDNSRVLHHWILYAGDGAFLSGWAPGGNADTLSLPPDVGIYLPSGAGAQLRLDVHYNNLGGTVAEEDASGVEVCVVSSAAKLRKNMATTHGFTASNQSSFLAPLAPAHATNFDDTSTCTVNGTAHILSGSPHMHKLGVHAKLVLAQGGKQQVVHDAAFNFNEQRIHPYMPELLLNTGDQVTTTCTYTNTTDQDVYFGQNTEDEMCFNFVLYYPKDGFTCF